MGTQLKRIYAERKEIWKCQAWSFSLFFVDFYHLNAVLILTYLPHGKSNGHEIVFQNDKYQKWKAAEDI